jgi:hypothetical protein
MTVDIAEADLELAWTQLPPGPELGIRLALVDWEALSDRELVGALEAANRQISWTQSMQLTAVAELARRRQGPEYLPDSDTERRIASEVSLALTATHGRAEELVWLAETLPGRLPATWAALRYGHLDYDRAKVMCDGLGGLDLELARALDAELIGDAVDSTSTKLRRKVTKVVKAADPGAHAERTKQARDERRVELWENDDDTCDLIGRNIDAAVAHAIHNRLTAAARALRADGDDRPIGQLRADLHTALLRGTPLPEAIRGMLTGPIGDAASPAAGDDVSAGTARTDAVLPGAQSTAYDADDEKRHDGRADLNGVVAAVEQLIAHALAEVADDHLAGLLDRVQAAGRLDGVTLLIGQAAQAMNNALAGLVDSWCRATGAVPGHHGHDGYRPPAAMQRLVQRRHSTCVFSTCTRRAIHSDLDHTIPYDQGGRTCKCNLAPLCRTHHRVIKQHPAWTLLQPWPGLLVWITPTGKWHIVTAQ